MAKQGTRRRRRRRPKAAQPGAVRFYDYNLVFLVIFLVVIGLIMIFSATGYSSSDDTNYFAKQAFFAIVGLVVMIVASFVPYRNYKRFAELGLWVSVFLILLVLTPLGRNSHGATRWLRFGGFGVQPAEVAKIAIIVFVATMISRLGRQAGKKNGAIIIFGAAGILFVLLFFVTDNLSSALIVFLIAFCMYFVAHPKLKPFLIMIGLGLIGVVLLVFLVKMLGSGAGSFRSERILAWLSPEEFASDTSFQTLQALYAIGSGGLFGKGLGSSAQKFIMPEVQNDMIFSIICEELGLFGAMVIILLFILLLYRIVYIARNVKDLFGSMLCIGVFSHIAIQVVLNIAVVTNSIPNTGISLPFISAGGSSLVFLMAEIGIVLNVSRSIPYE